MDFFVYITYSTALDRYYVGHCQDMDERLKRHNGGNGSTYTKKAKDWQLRWSEACSTRTLAVERERSIKKKKSRKYIEWLISKERDG